MHQVTQTYAVFCLHWASPWNNDRHYEKVQTNYEDNPDVADKATDMNSKEDKWRTAVTFQCSKPTA